VGTLPVAGPDQEEVPNEIKTAIPLLEAITIEGQDVTADALLTQREWATYPGARKSTKMPVKRYFSG
jgi:predicted transposase YbfD/YdcC